MRDQGRFISLEGGEGAGKSTQAQRLADHLAARGLPVLLTREPGGAPGAEAMRRLLLGGAGLDAVAEALLVFAARRDHLVSTLRPALAAGIWVISDRFVDSTRAYQGHGQGVPAAAIEALAAVALEGQAPDLTLVLDVPVAAGLARARARGVAADRYERLDEAFHQRIREGFLAIAAAAPGRCAVVDAARPPGAVAAAIASLVDARLP
ncbi:dTMP kinase [Falsiroseomonas selenitidurans]|uniref:Thymidylate kinase n=1 Tax=Falsiroseomonas selenitidurans TaxID=2716335 RepID=A0ABX1E7I9_9PROT|nr:dTMP kinase [Falsiroseomonas selenitidurans]NKC31492.1 dTMP kinase [Falsiroseomonas selenitidurans]